jgi:hypothetical protein
VIASLRGRLGTLAALLVMLGALIGGGATAVLHVYGDDIGEQAHAAVIIGSATLLILLVLAGVGLVHWASRPSPGSCARAAK